MLNNKLFPQLSVFLLSIVLVPNISRSYDISGATLKQCIFSYYSHKYLFQFDINFDLPYTSFATLKAHLYLNEHKIPTFAIIWEITQYHQNVKLRSSIYLLHVHTFTYNARPTEAYIKHFYLSSANAYMCVWGFCPYRAVYVAYGCLRFFA